MDKFICILIKYGNIAIYFTNICVLTSIIFVFLNEKYQKNKEKINFKNILKFIWEKKLDNTESFISIYFSVQIVLFIILNFTNNYNFLECLNVKETFNLISFSSLLSSIIISIILVIFNDCYLKHIKNIINEDLENSVKIKKLYNNYINNKIDNINDELKNYSICDLEFFKNTLYRVMDSNKAYILSISLGLIVAYISQIFQVSNSDFVDDVNDVILITIIIINLLFNIFILFILKSQAFDKISSWDINSQFYKELELFLYKKKKDISNKDDKKIILPPYPNEKLNDNRIILKIK